MCCDIRVLHFVGYWLFKFTSLLCFTTEVSNFSGHSDQYWIFELATSLGRWIKIGLKYCKPVGMLDFLWPSQISMKCKGLCKIGQILTFYHCSKFSYCVVMIISCNQGYCVFMKCEKSVKSKIHLFRCCCDSTVMLFWCLCQHHLIAKQIQILQIFVNTHSIYNECKHYIPMY